MPKQPIVPDEFSFSTEAEHASAVRKAKAEVVQLSIDFWLKCRSHVEADVRVVPRLALNALSVLMSNSIAERSFSVLSNRENDNVLSAGVAYVENMMFLSCNRKTLEAYGYERDSHLSNFLS